MSQALMDYPKPSAVEQMPVRASRFPRMESLWAVVFKFSSSLPLALLILGGLILVFAVGTFVESLYGLEAAAILVYQAPWFIILGFLLAVNLSASTLSRLPWKKKHIGFVMTHAGILLILLGSFITKIFMVDAQLAIEEGQDEYQISFPDPMLYVYSEDGTREWRIPFKRKAFPWSGHQTLEARPSQADLPFQMGLVNYYPKGRMRQDIVETPTGVPAVEVTLQNSFVNQTLWLMQNDPELGEVPLGPARLQFTDEFLKENTGPVPESGYLEFQFEKSQALVSIPEQVSLPYVFPIEGTPKGGSDRISQGTSYQGTLVKLFRNAILDNGELVERQEPAAMPQNLAALSVDEKTKGPPKGEAIGSTKGPPKGEAVGVKKGPAPENPAAVIRVEHDGETEEHTIFANFPDFHAMHGFESKVAAQVQIFYRLPGSGSRGETHALRFVKNSEGLFYQVQDGFEIRTGQVKIGEEVSTGWMDLKFRVKTYYPKARRERMFMPEPNKTESLQAFEAIRVNVREENQTESFWLTQGILETRELGGIRYHFIYGQRKEPLGFKLHLRDFKVEHYPGTNQPASYESDVTLKDDFRGVERDLTISMNHPLDYKGFRIFQSSYALEEGRPDVSIFSVVRDPGIFLKYSGTIVMVSGIIAMFAIGRLSFRKGDSNAESV